MGIGKKRGHYKRKKKGMIKGLYIYVFRLVNKSARRIVELSLNIVRD